MFNALNRFISRLDGDGAGPAQSQRENLEGYGFQVLRNTNLDLQIEPWFDYIIGINGRMIVRHPRPRSPPHRCNTRMPLLTTCSPSVPQDNPDSRLFSQEVRNCAGGSVSLGIWSAKGQRTRALQIPVSADNPSLGLSLQYAPVASASSIWHVLDVPANSPADVAGLLPYSDYVLGTPDGGGAWALDGEGALGELVEDHIGRPLRLWVYNHEYNVTREVDITPSRDWGGQGAIGCTLGFGALHRLPAPLSEPVHGPGETMFDGGDAGGFANLGAGATDAPPAGADSSEFLVPAQMVSGDQQQQQIDPQAATAAGPPQQTTMPTRNKRKEGRAANSNRGMMDDYFAEQEKKSKELEGGSSNRSTPAGKTPPPPPPKAGGPPPAAAAQAPAEGGD